MSMHTEWDVAATCNATVLGTDDANDELSPDEAVTAPFVLVLGGSGGGALVVEGTAAELQEFAERVLRAVREATT
jgi:hypothetical protein